MCMIELQNYIMTCQKQILINTFIYQMQKEIKWNANINLKSYFFKHSYDDWSENKESTDKEKSIDLSDMPPLEEATGRK